MFGEWVDTVTLSVIMAGLELREITCLCLLRAGIKDVHHHVQLLKRPITPASGSDASAATYTHAFAYTNTSIHIIKNKNK